jgi:hypothetical protein
VRAQPDFEILRVHPVASHHVDRDPDGRRETSRIGRVSGDQKLLRFHYLVSERCQTGDGLNRGERRVRRRRAGSGRPTAKLGEATHQILRLTIGIAGDVATGLGLVDPRAHLVEACQAEIDQRGGDRHASRSDSRQSVFGGVQGASHRRKIDDARAAFERVEGAKRAVEPLTVLGVLFQRQQVVVALADKFATLDQELLEKLVHRGTPHIIAMCSTRTSWLTGLTK